MLFKSLAVVAVAAVPALADYSHITVPSVKVPSCPAKGTIKYDKTVPDKAPFPLTEVALCYTATDISLTFTAHNETNFYFNPNYTTNDNIYEYEVMEAFIYHGTNDPSTYLELEVAPNNVTYQAFIYNPSKVRAPGAPFDHGFLDGPTDGILAKTTTDKDKKLWTSTVQVPLALFNVDNGM
jgi:hypothetical protein